MNRSSRLLRGLGIAFCGALFIAAVGFITMSLWNWLVPDLFRGPTITLPQTFGLLLLSRILFGGFGGHKGGWAEKRRHWQERMAGRMEHLSPEEREKFKQQMQQRCGMGFMRRPAAPEPAARQQPA